MPSKIALLSLVSSALAVPFAAFPRYPAGNTTVVLPTGYAEPTTTLLTTTVKTDTTVITQLVTLTRAPAASTGAPAAGGYDGPVEEADNGSNNSQCGGVVTSTVKEQVTVYVTAGAVSSTPTPAASAPSSAVAPVEPEQPAASPTFVTLAPSPTPAAEAPSSSAPAPVVEAPAPASSAPAPVAEVPSSSAEEPASYPTEAPTTPTYGSGKRGVAYNDGSLTQCFEKAEKVTWGFNWEADPRTLPESFEYVPMLWGLKNDFTSTWDSYVAQAKAKGLTNFMAFNEPDHVDQANLSPAAAADAYRKYMNPVAGAGIRLGAPSITNGGGAMGLTWLTSFMAECSDCSIDFCPVHWYDSASNVEYFKSHMAKSQEACNGKPIWVTEYGATGSDAEVSAFLETVNTWMDGQDYIERYAYFMVKEGSLVTGTAQSAIGKTYASA